DLALRSCGHRDRTVINDGGGAITVTRSYQTSPVCWAGTSPDQAWRLLLQTTFTPLVITLAARFILPCKTLIHTLSCPIGCPFGSWIGYAEAHSADHA
ncbi:MAG TPA: hypothetical protein VEW66_02930, partial [Thermomicrobiales bacterium]|nr:hypothetical protein [Thermomicrobiales bacterium]